MTVLQVNFIFQPFELEEIFIDGYGIATNQDQRPSPFLYRSFQRVTSNERCQSFFILDTTQAFCGEDREERSNVCMGDLGSPVVGHYRRNPYLAGIVRIHPSCGVSQPAAYTRISAFMQWIILQMV
jgi:Trypsin